ncbi:hypothetical protein BDV09DRAFT_164799 [Aspergillus tetrazonus]
MLHSLLLPLVAARRLFPSSSHCLPPFWTLWWSIEPGISILLFTLPDFFCVLQTPMRASEQLPRPAVPILCCWLPVTLSNRSSCLAALEREGPSSEVRVLGR